MNKELGAIEGFRDRSLIRGCRIGVMRALTVCLFLGIVLGNSEESRDTDEQRLIKHLFSNYSVNSRPVLNTSNPVDVRITIQLIKLDDVSEKKQSLRTKLHIRQEWNNPLLDWQPKSFGGVKELIVSKSKIWIPPIHLFNEASDPGKDSQSKDLESVMVSIAYDGNCSLTYASFYKSICPIDVTFFPFDTQLCSQEFGSWSQDEKLLRVHVKDPDAIGDRQEYEENGEWALSSAVLQQDVVKYRLNPRPHSIVRLRIKILRKYFFYMMNLVVPCALIACMIFLVFVLPPKSGERISLGITVLLSMAIFQELSSEKLPSSSDNFPLLGIYYTVSMFEIGMAMCLNCLVLNFYHRNYEMPNWIRKILLGKLADWFGVHVPDDRRYRPKTSFHERFLSKSELHPLQDLPMTDIDNASKTPDVENNTDLYRSSLNEVSSTSFNGKCNGLTHSALPKEETTSVRGRRNRKERLEDQGRGKLSKPNWTESEYTHDPKRNSEDWRCAARVLDRFLLAIAVFTGVFSASVIFLQAKRFREMFVP